MNMHHHFETARESSLRELTIISKILADLVRTCQLIESDIAAEEGRSGIFDQSDARYSILAKSLNGRRDNLKGTIATLEKRFTDCAAQAGSQRSISRVSAAGVLTRPAPAD
ncbi:hypothetical protein [Bradyrhizobium sp. NAS96.2]|uniref:hypothetical protein n=1 Tax=Bradyrhizobium sp. NAS96.2 TaxID=1680160 RepID=UPI001AECFC93|nr:hypothetical protein [Bradyrhizobium sp. NAS96.2]